MNITLVSHLVSLRLQKLLAVKYFNGLKSSDALNVFFFFFFTV